MNQTLTIAMLGSYPVDAARIWGGVQAAYRYLVKGLAAQPDLELHVLALRPSWYQGPDVQRQGGLTTHILPPYPRFERLRNYATFQKTVNSKLAQIRPDLIHVQDIAAEAYVALRSGYPTVVTVHGIRSEDRKHLTSWQQRLRSSFDSLFIENYNLSHAKHLIAISQYVSDYYGSILRPDIAIYHIPNAVDERFFCDAPVAGANTVLFAGRVTPRKRVLDLVQAFARVVKQVPSAQLRIAGETTSESAYADSVRQWVREARMEEHVHLLGPLSETAVLDEFANCSLLALPSAQETTPMVIAQAMAASKPVVATRVGGVAEMVGETGERGLLVDVGDTAKLAESMLALLQDRERQARTGQNAYAFALDNYHLNTVAQRTAEAYRSILLKEQAHG